MFPGVGVGPSESSVGRPVTVHGHQTDELVSSLRKAIRRGDEQKAAYAAWELCESGEAERVWRRLRIIAAEDCAGMFPLVFATQAAFAAKVAGPEGTMIAVKTAIELARHVRTEGGDRTADDLVNVFRARSAEGWKGYPPEDDDRDCHTRAGRAMGRGKEFFWANGCRLCKEHPAYDTSAREEMRRRLGIV